MNSTNSSLNFHQIAFFVVCVLVGQSFAQSHESVVYKFAGSPDGTGPAASLVADAAGNFYGTTAGGGISSCCGTVFELSPPATAGGSWSETILYSFLGGSDGSTPLGTLIFDKLGNLYGTTSGPTGSGSSIFELSPPSTPGGPWIKTTLLLFPDSTFGGPTGKLAMDAAGNLYGTTPEGGTHNKGLVFELVKPKTAGAPWAERILHNFGAFAYDGFGPSPDLLLRGGILYGTAQRSGTANQGTVFSLAPKNGVWTETTLHSFTGSEGKNPRGGLIMDSAGNLYGTTHDGGLFNDLCGSGCGTVFELSPPTVAGDPWAETTLFQFSGSSTGAAPYGALWHNKDGVLYGITTYGYSGNRGSNLGTVFKLKPPATAGGEWTEVVLHYFGGISIGDGSTPTGALILSNGVFYGTTEGGGDGSGTVFSLSVAP